jgi:hypothetical protein
MLLRPRHRCARRCQDAIELRSHENEEARFTPRIPVVTSNDLQFIAKAGSHRTKWDLERFANIAANWRMAGIPVPSVSSTPAVKPTGPAPMMIAACGPDACIQERML